MKRKKVITMIAAALAFTMTVCGSSTAIAASELTAESKPATQYTIDANQEVYVLLVFADPENTDARYLCADALEQLGYQAESGPWRSAYLCAAQELRNGTNTDDATRSNGNGDVFLHMTPDMILDYLGIFVDTTKIPEGNYVLRVKNGILLYQKDTQDPDADVTWTTKRAGLLSIVQKNAENVAALIEQEGDETCLMRLMDAVTVSSEYKYFNIIEP